MAARGLPGAAGLRDFGSPQRGSSIGSFRVGGVCSWNRGLAAVDVVPHQVRVIQRCPAVTCLKATRVSGSVRGLLVTNPRRLYAFCVTTCPIDDVDRVWGIVCCFADLAARRSVVLAPHYCEAALILVVVT